MTAALFMAVVLLGLGNLGLHYSIHKHMKHLEDKQYHAILVIDMLIDETGVPTDTKLFLRKLLDLR